MNFYLSIILFTGLSLFYFNNENSRFGVHAKISDQSASCDSVYEIPEQLAEYKSGPSDFHTYVTNELNPVLKECMDQMNYVFQNYIWILPLISLVESLR